MYSLERLWPRLGTEIWSNHIAASPLVPRAARYLLLRSRRFRFERCAISSGVEWFGSGSVRIGAGTFINRGVMVNHSAHVSIGARVAIGPRSVIATASHALGTSEERAGSGFSAPVTIGDGVWIGASVTILPGITIGSGTVIAAGSVVRQDCAPDSLYGGVPAKLIRPLDASAA